MNQTPGRQVPYVSNNNIPIFSTGICASFEEETNMQNESFTVTTYGNKRQINVSSLGNSYASVSNYSAGSNREIFRMPHYQQRQPDHFKMKFNVRDRFRRPTPYFQHQRPNRNYYPIASASTNTSPQVQGPILHNFDSFPSSPSPRQKQLIPSPIPKQLIPSPEDPIYEQWKLEKLSKDIWKLYYENRQNDEVHFKKMRLRDKLHEILRIQHPNCGLYVVGSSMTGLGVKSSDMDMCLMLTDYEIDQKTEAIKILRRVKRLFDKHNFIRRTQVIRAKVPIIKFFDQTCGIEVDLNVNNSVGIRNTQLLSSYARIDKRFPPLIILIKLWARFHNINDASQQSLSSYSIVLMVIHYLQNKCQPPVLPILQQMQPDKFNLSTDVRDLKVDEDLPDFVSSNKQDLGELFLGFLGYYGTEFNYKRDAISIRLGETISLDAASKCTASPNNSYGQWKLLGIEEPFDRSNVARAVFNNSVFNRVIQTFRKSWKDLKKSLDLHSMLRIRI